MLRLSLVAALLVAAAGCGDDTTTASTFDLAGPTSVTGDMAAAGGGGGDMMATGAVDMARPAGAPMTASISIHDNFYTPADVTIAAGGTVTWTWAGSNPHTVTSGSGTPSGMFDSGVKTSGTFSFTFPSAGSFSYYCQVHGFAVMHGTVTVQ